jgi:serine/threonine protein phosphatase PrpC
MSERISHEQREMKEKKYSLTTSVEQRIGRSDWYGEEKIKEKSGDTVFCQGPLVIMGDGVGGYEHDQEASSVAVETAARTIASRLANLDQIPRLSSQDVEQYLDEAFVAARSALDAERHRIQDKTMNTTLIASLVFFDTLQNKLKYCTAQVGDGRTYRIRGDEVRVITDDSVLGVLALECGMPEIFNRYIDGTDEYSLMKEVGLEEIAAKAQRNTSVQPGLRHRNPSLLVNHIRELHLDDRGKISFVPDFDRIHQVLGSHDDRRNKFEPGIAQMRFIDVQPGDLLVVSSDGINRVVNPWEYDNVVEIFQEILKKNSSQNRPQACTRALIDATVREYDKRTSSTKRIDDITVVATFVNE